MRTEIILMLDALNYASDKLLSIQRIVSNERDMNALKELITLAIEYITQLNLMLLKTPEELESEQFKNSLIIGAADLFIDGVQNLQINLNLQQQKIGELL